MQNHSIGKKLKIVRNSIGSTKGSVGLNIRVSKVIDRYVEALLSSEQAHQLWHSANFDNIFSGEVQSIQEQNFENIDEA